MPQGPLRLAHVTVNGPVVVQVDVTNAEWQTPLATSVVNTSARNKGSVRHLGRCDRGGFLKRASVTEDGWTLVAKSNRGNGWKLASLAALRRWEIGLPVTPCARGNQGPTWYARGGLLDSVVAAHQ